MQQVRRLLRPLLHLVLRVAAIVSAPVGAAIAKTGIGTDVCLDHGFLPISIHYYQPIFDHRKVPPTVWDRVHDLPGIEFDSANQLEWLARVAAYADECHWPRTGDPASGYFWDNASFGHTSASLLHCATRLLRPNRVVEIGAGMSTLVFADALQRNGTGALTTIDPFPKPFVRGVGGPVSLVTQPVQEVDLSVFEDSDLIFIDSSHVARTGGDVNTIYLDILPRLKPGTTVHIHDIYLPYDYPRVYSQRERSRYFWNEQYLLQAFLTLNSSYRVALAAFYLQMNHRDAWRSAFPRFDPAKHRPTTSFYIARV